MPRKTLRLWFCLMALAPAPAQTVAEAAGQLAARISSLLPPRPTASFEFQNISSFPAAESSAFRDALEQALKNAGIAISAAAQPDTQVRVSISENLQGPLLVAEIRTGDRRQTIFQPWTAARPPATRRRLKLERKPVWEQPEPVLDFALLNSGTELLILGAGKVSMYRMADGKWSLASMIAVSLSRPLPRDLRGRLATERDTFRAFLPGTSCNGVAQVPLVITCSPGNETWTIDASNRGPAVRWVNDRNYLEAAGAQTAFYSATSLDNGARMVFATLDGRVRDRGNEPVGGTDAWGSDFTGPLQACGSNSLVVAARGGDNEGPDAVQAYEIGPGAAEPVSEPVSLSGPVTALWPAGSEVALVLRNTKTGNYEASRLHLACAE